LKKKRPIEESDSDTDAWGLGPEEIKNIDQVSCLVLKLRKIYLCHFG
jgi:hypothetical protein